MLAGWYRQELTFEALEAACEAVFGGRGFYSASQSLFFATAEGRQLGTSRAISAVVRDVTGCRVTVVGKPSLQALQVAARHLGVAPDELAVVGDDPELEVPMAHEGGALAVAVHTGIGHGQSFTDLPEDAAAPGPAGRRRPRGPAHPRLTGGLRPHADSSGVFERRDALVTGFPTTGVGGCASFQLT